MSWLLKLIKHSDVEGIKQMKKSFDAWFTRVESDNAILTVNGVGEISLPKSMVPDETTGNRLKITIDTEIVTK